MEASCLLYLIIDSLIGLLESFTQWLVNLEVFVTMRNYLTVATEYNHAEVVNIIGFANNFIDMRLPPIIIAVYTGIRMSNAVSVIVNWILRKVALG